MDFPTAWEIARETPPAGHDPECSFAQTSGALLCDCHVLTRHPQYLADYGGEHEGASMQKPTIGRIVIVPVDPATSNGADVAPAVITRVWNETCINVRVLLDAPDAEWKTSLELFPDADAMRDAHTSQDASRPPHAAYWPPRA